MIQRISGLLYGYWAMYTGLYSLDFWLYFTSPGFLDKDYEEKESSQLKVIILLRV